MIASPRRREDFLSELPFDRVLTGDAAAALNVKPQPRTGHQDEARRGGGKGDRLAPTALEPIDRVQQPPAESDRYERHETSFGQRFLLTNKLGDKRAGATGATSRA